MRRFAGVAAAMAMLLAGGGALAQAGDVSAPVAALDAALLTALKSSAQPFKSRYDALAPAVDHAFNLPQILQTVVGLRWAAIPADQQKSLLATFRAYTVASYASNFTGDPGTDIKLLPEHSHDRRRPRGGDADRAEERRPDPYRLRDAAGHRRVASG